MYITLLPFVAVDVGKLLVFILVAASFVLGEFRIPSGLLWSGIFLLCLWILYIKLIPENSARSQSDPSIAV